MIATTRPPRTRTRSASPIAFHDGLPLGQLRFVYQTPGAIINRTYAYELKGIELP